MVLNKYISDVAISRVEIMCIDGLQSIRPKTSSPTLPTRPITNSPQPTHFTYFTNSPHLFYQLALLILPTLPTFATNSPHVVCQLAQFSDQLAPTFTYSPHFSYQLAPLHLPTRPTFLPTTPTSRTKYKVFYFTALTTLINQNKL